MSYDDPCKLRQRTNFGNHWKNDHTFEDFFLEVEHSKMAVFPLPWLVFSYIFGTRYLWYHTGGHSELASEWGNPLLSMFDKSKASKVWLRDFTTGEVLPIYMHMFPAQTTDITRVYQGDVLS